MVRVRRAVVGAALAAALICMTSACGDSAAKKGSATPPASATNREEIERKMKEGGYKSTAPAPDTKDDAGKDKKGKE
jgi:hypothetical protein